MSRDLLCPLCGEPWEIDTLHDAAEDQGHTFGEVLAGFRRRGCVALSGFSFGLVACNPNGDRRAAGLASALFDILGDDVDGMAADLEDLGGWL
jgi:hypothetical protein